MFARTESSDLTPQAYTLSAATGITINRQSVYKIGKFVTGVVSFKSANANPSNLLYLPNYALGRMDLPFYDLDTWSIKGIVTISAGSGTIFRNTGAIDANASYCIDLSALIQ